MSVKLTPQERLLKEITDLIDFLEWSRLLKIWMAGARPHVMSWVAATTACDLVAIGSAREDFFCWLSENPFPGRFATAAQSHPALSAHASEPCEICGAIHQDPDKPAPVYICMDCAARILGETIE